MHPPMVLALAGFGLWGDRLIGSFLVAFGVCLIFVPLPSAPPGPTNRRVISSTALGVFLIVQGVCLLYVHFGL